MIRPVRYGRLATLAVTVLLAFSTLLGWVFYRQITVHPRFREEARRNLNFKRTFPARRGGIADSRGVMLATSVPVKTVCANPELVAPQRVLLARTLAPLLELPAAAVLKDLQPRLLHRQVNGSNVVITSRYAVLKHKVSLEQWQQITQRMATLDFGVDEKKLKPRARLLLRSIRSRGIFAQDDYLRQYPNGSLAAHVVGFVGSGETETDEGYVFEDHGLAGLELTFDDLLNGTHGWQTGEVNVPPSPGQTLVLTLDASVQYIVETELAKAAEEFKPNGVIGIVVRPRTGEILAMANWPTFDLNRPGSNPAAYRNRAVADMYEPGSTFKTVTIATALEAGVLTLDERVNCENGRWRYGGSDLTDSHPHQILTFAEVVEKSSNIGAAKAAVRIGAQRFYNSIRNFGFGAPTQIPLPNETPGLLRAPKDWSGISITRIPMGQEICASPLQMAMAVAAIANGGLWVRPRLVDHLEDGRGHVTSRYPIDPPRRVVSEATARELTRALKLVVSPEGTAPGARLDHYTVAGKTGTGQKSVNGTYHSGKYYSSFVGFFPADDPQVCILVAVDEPIKSAIVYTGGAVASPAFKAIGERVANYLRIEPDIPAETSPMRPSPENPADLVANRSFVLNPTKGRPAATPRR